MKVERVQVFGFSLISWTSKTTGTKFGLGWLPLGGYCLLPDLHAEQSSWKKIVVLSGGVVNNLVLGFIIFMAIAWLRTPDVANQAHVAAARGAEMFANSLPDTSQVDISDSGGLISVANIFGSTWRWFRFWFITASLSVFMALCNLIPIPGLDGGQITFTAIEVVMRRPINENVKLCANLLGLLLVFAFFVYGNYNDICRLLD